MPETSLQIRLLGPLEVVGEHGLLALPEGRARNLIAVLAMKPGRIVPTDVLIDRLWGAKPPATARTKLYGLVSTLRKTLAMDGEAERELIRTQSPGYVLAVDGDQVDVFRFRRLVGTAAELQTAERSRILSEALDLWRGPALVDFAYDPFAQTEITSLEELRLTAIEDRVAADLALGRHTAVVPELDALVRENPFRERLRAQAMVALYRSGNQQKALQVYRDAWELFAEELGIEPGTELQELDEAILRHDPALELTPVTREEPDAAATPAQETEAEPWMSESRRIVTVMYVDVGLSSASGTDPEAHRALARRVHEHITETLYRHGGSSQGSIGGVAVGVFGIPTAHEDDPFRAVRAAMDLMQALTGLSSDADRGPVARIGVNTGEVVVGSTGLAGSGLPENTVRQAARLQQSAESGEILIGDRTRQLVSNGVTLEPAASRIRDDAGRFVTAWRLVGVDPFSRASGGEVGEPLVGRERELTRLVEAFERAIYGGSPRRITLTGAAGIGKSRLAVEFANAVAGRARVVTGHCPPYGEGITFWPLREIVEDAAGGTTREAIARLVDSLGGPVSIVDHIVDAIGSAEAPQRPDILFSSLRMLFEALATDRPLVVVVEDLHWAQPTFLELIDYSTEYIDRPALFLCLTRPELLERQRGWTDGRGNSETLVLETLGTEHVEQLVDLTIAKHDLPHERAHEVVELAEGNPLFVHQMLAALRDDGELTVPPSIQGLLLARLDRLGPAEQDVIKTASVMGRRFDIADLVELLPQRARDSTPIHLDSLARKELISRIGTSRSFSFSHALIRLVAYRTLTKDARARLHERFAEQLDLSSAEGDVTSEELAGYHLEQSVRYRRELGIDDTHTRHLATTSGERLSRAGLRAFRRFDVVAAESLLTRAETLLPEGHPDRPAVIRRLAETDQVMGRHDKAVEVFDSLIRNAESVRDETLEQFFRLERAWANIARGPDPITLEEIEEQADRAREVFERSEDETGLAQVCRVVLHLHHRRGDMAKMQEAADEGLDHAGRSSSTREQLGAQWLVAIALEEGPSPVAECISRCEEILRIGDVENPGVVSALGYFRAMSGDFPRAKQLAVRARQILRERVRARRPLGHVLRREGDVELLSGDVAAGLSTLREALDLNAEMGERDVVAQIAAVLTRLHVEQGDIGEAERLATMSRASAPSQSVSSQAQWRSARARVLSSQGRSHEAISLAREAAGLVPDTMLNLKADMSLSLGETLIQLGDQRSAEASIREAIDLYGQKGNRVGAERARALIG